MMPNGKFAQSSGRHLFLILLGINVNNKYKSKSVLLNLNRKIGYPMTKYIYYDVIEMEGQFLHDSAAMTAALALPEKPQAEDTVDPKEASGLVSKTH